MSKTVLVMKVNTNDRNIPFVGYSLDVLKKYYSHEVTKKYATFSNDNEIFVLYPDIVISSSNPMINKLAIDLTSLLSRYGEIVASVVFDLFPYMKLDDSSNKVIEFDHGYFSDCDNSPVKIEFFSEEMELSYRNRPVTENTIYLSLNRFDYIMELLTTLDNGFELFRKNLTIFCSAYVKYTKDENYENRRDEILSLKSNWISFAKKYSASEQDALRAYDQTENYSYSILTIEEILKEQSKEIRNTIKKYNDEVFESKVKRVLRSKDEITHNEMHLLFSEYIRQNHFFHDKEIYLFTYPIVEPVSVNTLSSLVESFLTVLESIKHKIEFQSDESESERKVFVALKFNAIRKAFSNNMRNTMIKDSCANYLNVPKITKGASNDLIVFKDYCIQYTIIDEVPTLVKRRSYMEDRLLSFISYESIMDYHKTPEGLQAIADVNKTYKRMFKYDETVDFFKSWLGSTVLRDPQRCIVFLVGKSGENAKSGLSNALLNGLGNKTNIEYAYAKSCAASMFYPNNKSGVTCDPYWATMDGAMIAVVPESNSRFQYCAATLKEASGADFKMVAKKFKDATVIKHSAKIIIVGNDFPTFDNFDKALQSRAYPLVCHGVFKENPADVPETEEEQNELGIYHADRNFWNNDRIKAQLWIIFNEGFELYKKNGLKRSPQMEVDLKNWLISSSNYVKFSLDLEYFTPDGRPYRTSAEDLKNTFAKRFNKFDLSTENFIADFERDTGFTCRKIDDIYYYDFKHKNSQNFIIEAPEKHTIFQTTSLPQMDSF